MGQIGRGEKVRAAVVAATLEELVETGYPALTVDAIARRAGVHKTTVYRRWADREALVADALTEQLAAEIPMPATGSIDDDLVVLARGLVAWLGSTFGRAVVATILLRAAGIDDLHRRVFADRLRRAEPVVRAAVERGELPAGTDPAELIRVLVAPIWFRAAVSGEPVDDDVADRAAAVALAAARAGVVRPHWKS